MVQIPVSLVLPTLVLIRGGGGERHSFNQTTTTTTESVVDKKFVGVVSDTTIGKQQDAAKSNVTTLSWSDLDPPSVVEQSMDGKVPKVPAKNITLWHKDNKNDDSSSSSTTTIAKKTQTHAPVPFVRTLRITYLSVILVVYLADGLQGTSGM